MRSRISTSNAPAAIGPYRQAIATEGLVFCSGQVGIDPATKQLAEGIEARSAPVVAAIPFPRSLDIDRSDRDASDVWLGASRAGEAHQRSGAQ